MEQSLLEQMCGDLGPGHCESPVVNDEDSLDIYYGLDNSPRNSQNAEKSCPPFSPRRLKDSMDLYEEIIKEEQQEKEATCNELKTKLGAAQNHVKELLQRLEQIQQQNASLHIQNTCLKKNICALFKTARMEILRKDDEISRLSQRGGRGGYNPSLNRSQIHFQRNQDSSQNSAPTPNPATGSETQGSGVNSVPKGPPEHHSEDKSVSLNPEPLDSSLLTPSCPGNSTTTRTDSAFPNRLSDSDVPDNERDSNIPKSTTQKDPIHQTGKSQPENYDAQKNCVTQAVISQQKNQKSEVGDPQDQHSTLDASKENKLNGREKLGKDKDCLNSSRGRHQGSYPELPRSLERGKRPPHQRNHSPPTSSSHCTASSSHSQKIRPREKEQQAKSSSREVRVRDMEPPAKSSSREVRVRDIEPPAKGSIREVRVRDMEPPAKSSSREVRARDTEPPAKSSSREVRARDMEPPAKSSSRESRSRNMEPLAKGGSQENRSRDVEPPAKSSSREVRHSQNGGRDDPNGVKSFGREGKRSGSDQGRLSKKSSASSRKASGSPTRDHCRKRERTREEEKSNRERKATVTDKSKDYEKNKGKDAERRRDGNRKIERKKDKVLESSVDSKNGKQTPNTLTTSTDSHDLARKGQEDRKDQDKQLTLEQVPVNNAVEPEFAVGHEVCEKSLPEEGKRNRKLSFMETLNLTLSPVKKPRLTSEGKEPESGQSEDTPEGPPQENSQFNLGEEFCVLDELDSSNGTSKEMDEVFEAPAAESSDICEAEKTQGPHPELEFKIVDEEHAQDKEETVVQAHLSCLKTKCDSERIVDEHTLLRTDGKFPTVDQPAKHAASPEPNDCKDSGSGSELVDGVVMTSLPAVSQYSGAESITGTSVVSTVLITDDIHLSCSSYSAGRTSSICESASVKSVAHDPAIVCMESCSPDNSNNDQSEYQKIPLVQPESISQDASSSVPVNTLPRGDGTVEEACDVSADAVSSTVSIEVVSQSTDIVVPDVQENVVISSTGPEKYVEKTAPAQNLTAAQTQSAEIPKVSSTFRDEIAQPEQGQSGAGHVVQDCCGSEPDSTEDEEWNNRTEPSSSVLVAHDEDSMMLTLKNIRHIPEAISPLTSPVRPVEKTLPHSSAGNAQHVRSLNRDFSTITGAKRMDVNKENEKPHCSSTQFPHADLNQTPRSPSSRSEDNELEEGEIVSDSEEDEPAVIPTPQPRKTQSVAAIKKRPSPSSPRLAKTQDQKQAAISQGHSGMKSKTQSTLSDSPTSNKRHRTVLPLLPTTSPSSISEVIDMLKLIKAYLRKKYMKFHKNLAKKSFSNIIDMSLCSFTDFVNNTSFRKFCGLESILKPKLIHIISVTMDKISNNGIVNRIFEQQSPSLKKKLWSFVEDQFEFLFREIQAILASLCNPSEVRHLSKTENKVERNRENVVRKVPTRTAATTVAALKKDAEVDLVDMSRAQNKVKPTTITPRRMGLGSRGKNLQMNKEEHQSSKARDLPSSHSPSKTALTQYKKSSSGEKSAALVRQLSHSSTHDKSDFEILTEQQASSLTFNLVTDSQMGEIFKCLLQGSDLLENSVSVGDAPGWPVGTPRKDATGGESSIVVMTPNKTTLTPSKVIATWSAISPCKLSSPNPKMHIPLNPAVLDENCLLEVPSGSLPFGKETPSSTVPSQRSYSLLAEDLAVSLTIPSPLKSDGHLSFLQPESTEPMSAPESVISAHYSEDALMDGEDATEQDIHLALDSDNSSAGSNGCRTGEDAAMPSFQFKPHLPMQAVVMEKSNDHFIVRIRHTSTSFSSSPDHNAMSADKESQKVVGDGEEFIDSAHSAPDNFPSGNGNGKSCSPASCANHELQIQNKVPFEHSLSESGPTGKTVNSHDVNAAHSHRESVEPAPTNGEIAESASPSELVIVTEGGSASMKSSTMRKKRKKHHSQPRAKRVKMEHTQEKGHKQRKKRSSSVSRNKGTATPRKKGNKSKLPPLSPNSLSAKNVIRKKGEVVVTWTRDEDRDILIELKKKGASPDTFAALSAKMNKTPALIAERFCQLMKLFKKKERMGS